MTTTKSYSSNDKFVSAYVSALKAQFPFAVVSGIIFIIMFVIVFFISTTGNYRPDPDSAKVFFTGYFRQGIYAGIEQSIVSQIVLAVLALASTLMGLRYLHNKKTVDLYHSLPVSRPKLLGANLLATLTAILGPYLLIYMITMLIQLITCARYDCFGPNYFLFILVDILASVIYISVIVAFIAFVAVNVGTVFDAFALTITLGFAPSAIYLISGLLWQSLVYGAYFEPSDNLLCLSPFMFIYKIWLIITENSSLLVTYNGAAAMKLGKIAVFLISGLIAAAAILAAAMVCYRRRKSEIAEQTQPRGVLQIIVKMFAVFVGGSMFFAIFDESGLSVGRVFFVLLGAVSIGLIAEIIFSRGVKWIIKNSKWLLGAGVVYCLLLICVNADLIGYASRVPSPDSVESVQINYRGRFDETDGHPNQYDNYGPSLTEAESIAIIRDMHNIIVNNRPPRDGNGRYAFNNGSDFTYNFINLNYKLKNGSTMRRTYGPIHIGANQKLVELEAQDDFIRSKSTLFWAEQNPKFGEVTTVELYASFGSRIGQHANVLDDPEPLLSAIKADMLDQSLGDIIYPTEPALGFIRVNFKEIDYAELRREIQTDYSYSGPLYATVVVTKEYKRTLEVLRQLDLKGNFVDETPNLDDITEVKIAPGWNYGYAGTDRIRSFNPWNTDRVPVRGQDLPEFVVCTDPTDMKAIAKVSKDMLYSLTDNDWNIGGATVFFELKEGTVITKAVKIDDLPAKIRDEVLKGMPEMYKNETNTTVIEDKTTTTVIEDKK